MTYKEIYEDSIEHQKSWAEQADAIEWYNKPGEFYRKMKMDIILKDEVNICYLALDKAHSDGYGVVNFIYDSVTQTIKKYTYSE
jgi:propionyl-CoA synthetase